MKSQFQIGTPVGFSFFHNRQNELHATMYGIIIKVPSKFYIYYQVRDQNGEKWPVTHNEMWLLDSPNTILKEMIDA